MAGRQRRTGFLSLCLMSEVFAFMAILLFDHRKAADFLRGVRLYKEDVDARCDFAVAVRTHVPCFRLITGTLSLVGDEPVTQDVKRSRAFRLGDAYEFKDVPIPVVFGIPALLALNVTKHVNLILIASASGVELTTGLGPITAPVSAASVMLLQEVALPTG